MPGRPEDRLLDRFAALPASRPLLARLTDTDGVYLVGGAVRDLLLGIAPLDLDLVVEGDVEGVAALLGAPTRVHERFSTCTVALAGFSYDLARSRRESYAEPGALPTVAPASLDEDLDRRDFTVNALALGLGGRRRGELVSVPGALDDLARARLRVLHDASFLDDPTRLLRLARYASRLRFEPDGHTLALAAAAIEGGALETVSGARVGAELRLLAAEPDPVGALCRLRELGLDAALAAGFGLSAPDLAVRALALLPADGDRGALVLAAASIALEAGALARMLDRLAFGAGRRDTILAAASRAPLLARALEAASRPSEIASAAGGQPPELVALAGALGPADADAADAARRWLADLRHVALEIDGGDLLAFGVPAGPPVGAGLRAALAAKLDGRARGREQELAEALRVAADTRPGARTRPGTG